jgi:hypothetical protein
MLMLMVFPWKPPPPLLLLLLLLLLPGRQALV